MTNNKPNKRVERRRNWGGKGERSGLKRNLRTIVGVVLGCDVIDVIDDFSLLSARELINDSHFKKKSTIFENIHLGKRFVSD